MEMTLDNHTLSKTLHPIFPKRWSASLRSFDPALLAPSGQADGHLHPSPVCSCHLPVELHRNLFVMTRLRPESSGQVTKLSLRHRDESTYVPCNRPGSDSLRLSLQPPSPHRIPWRTLYLLWLCCLPQCSGPQLQLPRSQPRRRSVPTPKFPPPSSHQQRATGSNTWRMAILVPPTTVHIQARPPPSGQPKAQPPSLPRSQLNLQTPQPPTTIAKVFL